MKLPRTIQIFTERIRVKPITPLVRKAYKISHKTKGFFVWPKLYEEAPLIYVNPKLSNRQQYITVWHELIHAVNDFCSEATEKREIRK